MASGICIVHWIAILSIVPARLGWTRSLLLDGLILSGAIHDGDSEVPRSSVTRNRSRTYMRNGNLQDNRRPTAKFTRRKSSKVNNPSGCKRWSGVLFSRGGTSALTNRLFAFGTDSCLHTQKNRQLQVLPATALCACCCARALFTTYLRRTVIANGDIA